MDKHTPGPWKVKLEMNCVPAQVWAEGRQVAEVYGESREARAANARLMAAAPELLKALQDIIVEFWAEYEFPDRAPEQSPTVKEIRKADHVIRKAKGELIPNVLSEFNRLCQRRDLAAYRAVAAIQTVVKLRTMTTCSPTPEGTRSPREPQWSQAGPDYLAQHALRGSM